ncbi:hypothetical protein ACFLQV_02175 [Calditrichota bacterium]
MNIPRRVTTVVTCLMFVFSMSVVTGCTKYASPDDLQTLDEAKQAATSAEKDLASKKKELKMVEQELAMKQDTLKAAEMEREAVKQRMEEKSKMMEAAHE